MLPAGEARLVLGEGREKSAGTGLVRAIFPLPTMHAARYRLPCRRRAHSNAGATERCLRTHHDNTRRWPCKHGDQSHEGALDRALRHLSARQEESAMLAKSTITRHLLRFLMLPLVSAVWLGVAPAAYADEPVQGGGTFTISF